MPYELHHHDYIRDYLQIEGLCLALIVIIACVDLHEGGPQTLEAYDMHSTGLTQAVDRHAVVGAAA